MITRRRCLCLDVPGSFSLTMAKTLFALVVLMTIQYAFSAPFSFKWCALPTETSKCADFITYVKKTAQNISLDVTASCVAGSTTEDCMTKIKDGQADLVTLASGKTGDIYKAGKSYSLVPIVSEQYGEYGVYYYAIAVVKKNNTGFDIKSLEGRKTCHTGVGRTAGWIVPMGYLLSSKIMPALGCDNVNYNFISASNYFNESCVPGAPTEFSNLCVLCAGAGADKCSPDSSKNRYVGHEGAFACMSEGKGDVAFVKHSTTQKVVDKGNGKWADYEYLCMGGGRKDADPNSHKSCHVGFSPARAVVTRKGNTNIPSIIKILMTMSDWYGDNQKDWSKFQLFNSTSYSGDSDLIFKDSTTELKGIAAANQSYMRYLGNFGKDIEAFKSCDFLLTSTPQTSTPRPITAVSTVTSPVTALALLIALFSILLL